MGGLDMAWVRLSLLASAMAILLAAATAVWPADSAAAPGPLKATPDGRPLVQTFFDDFDTFRHYNETTKIGIWRSTYGPIRGTEVNQRTLKSNGELQLYVDTTMPYGDRPFPIDPFRVRDGVLHLIADRTPASLKERLSGYPYTSGMITTQTSFEQTYGYFEMRAKLPRGKGLWTAFWLLPADMSWPPEIDIVESIGDPTMAYMTTHSTVTERPTVNHQMADDGFHVFAVSWDREQIIWYIDGVETTRQPTPGDMHKPMFILANLAVGGHWPGAPDASTKLPSSLAIDYIRAYRFGP